MKQSCVNCAYCEIIGKVGEGKHICRRYAPRPVTQYLEGNDAWSGEVDPQVGEPVWPVVTKDVWCGEFAYKVIPFHENGFGKRAKLFFRVRMAQGKPISTRPDFLSITRLDVLKIRQVGATTWREIERRQNLLREEINNQ